MNYFKKQSANFSQRGPDDLVLEETVEETETTVGHGQANIFKTTTDVKSAITDASETTKANKRAHKQKLLSGRGVSLKAGNINGSFREKEVPDCRQSKNASEKSDIGLLARQVEDRVPYILWKSRWTETTPVKENDRELSLPPIFLSKINHKQQQPNLQSRSSYARYVERQNEKQDENVKTVQKVDEHSLGSFVQKTDEHSLGSVVQKVDEHSLGSFVQKSDEHSLGSVVDKPSVVSKAKVSLRMKLEQIKNLDQKKNGERASVKEDSVAETSKETTDNVCETTEPDISDVESSHCTDNKDFLHVKQELHSVQHFQPIPLQLELAKDLKKLVLGSSSLTFQDEWKFQGFYLPDHPTLQYGIVQKKSGPCGIFSVVQAFLLRHLLFIENLKLLNQSLQPSVGQKTTALASALAAIFWQAGQQKKAVVAVLGKKAHLNPSSIRTDGITEKVLVVTLERYEDLLYFLTQNIDQYRCVSGPGLILSVYSTILSHTIQRVRDNMDDPNGRLIESNGCCSQELLNLFLTGNAVTNVFNNDDETMDGNGERLIRRGIVSRSEVGLLSLSECQKSSCEVGTYLKTPKYPIWLLQIESNFSVLFSPKKVILSDWKAEKIFDLYYYNCLNKQNDEIRLTIDNLNAFYCPPTEEEVVSPVELCIRTKWNKAEIHWNGIEPLLI